MIKTGKISKNLLVLGIKEIRTILHHFVLKSQEKAKNPSKCFSKEVINTAALVAKVKQMWIQNEIECEWGRRRYSTICPASKLLYIYKRSFKHKLVQKQWPTLLWLIFLYLHDYSTSIKEKFIELKLLY